MKKKAMIIIIQLRLKCNPVTTNYDFMNSITHFKLNVVSIYRVIYYKHYKI